MTCRIRSSSQSGTSQRTGIGVAPAFQQASAANTNSGELRSAIATRSPTADAPLDERAGDLARPAVELGPGEHLLAAVAADVHVHLGLRLLVGQLPEPLDEADRGVLHQQGSGAPKIDPQSRSSKLNSASSTKLPSSPSGAGASGSKR